MNDETFRERIREADRAPTPLAPINTSVILRRSRRRRYRQLARTTCVLIFAATAYTWSTSTPRMTVVEGNMPSPLAGFDVEELLADANKLTLESQAALERIRTERHRKQALPELDEALSYRLAFAEFLLRDGKQGSAIAELQLLRNESPDCNITPIAVDRLGEITPTDPANQFDSRNDRTFTEEVNHDHDA